jgi:uncharacterized membrane protein YphA (DoxX/SURF4 family)
MLDFFTSPYFLLFARLFVGGVFVVSGIAKWLDKPGTEANMSRYRFLPIGSGKLIAAVFPVLELAVGLLLVLGLFTTAAALGAVALFAVFTVLIVYDLSRGENASCHCFGRLSDEKLTPMAVVRNLVLMALSLFVAFGPAGWFALDSAMGITREGAPAVQADAANVVPIVLLALLAVFVVVYGGQAVSMVRNTLRGLGFR